MVDESYALADDLCQVNPINCEDGLSFSIWERLNYDKNVLVDFKTEDYELKYTKKYIVSTGVDYDVDEATAYPGFAIYHHGVSLVAVVSTGEKVIMICVCQVNVNITHAACTLRPHLYNCQLCAGVASAHRWTDP